MMNLVVVEAKICVYGLCSQILHTLVPKLMLKSHAYTDT